MPPISQTSQHFENAHYLHIAERQSLKLILIMNPFSSSEKLSSLSFSPHCSKMKTIIICNKKQLNSSHLTNRIFFLSILFQLLSNKKDIITCCVTYLTEQEKKNSFLILRRELIFIIFFCF